MEMTMAVITKMVTTPMQNRMNVGIKSEKEAVSYQPRYIWVKISSVF